MLAALLLAVQPVPLDEVGKLLDQWTASGPEQPGDPSGLIAIPDNPAARGFVVPPPPSPDLFGTHATPGPLLGKAGASWLGVRDQGASPPALLTLLAPVRAIKPAQQIGFVQALINHRIPNRLDIDWWGEEDYWATAEETRRTNGGDCEDIAIIKLQALRVLGFPVDSLYSALAAIPRGATTPC